MTDMSRPYLSREEVVALFIEFQDSVADGLRLRQDRATDYLQADAYEQAIKVVFATPFAPPKE